MSAPMVDYSNGKRCCDCKEVLPVSEFYLRRDRRDGNGLQSRCKKCSNRTRVRDRRRHTGLSSEQYMSLLVTQCGMCAICGEPESARAARPREEGAVRRLNADHDHLTGTPRALLCSRCNTTLGLMNDNPALLRRAAAYLEEYSQCAV